MIQVRKNEHFPKEILREKISNITIYKGERLIHQS